VSFIVDAATGAFEQTVDRIRRNEDHGGFNPRPKLDEKQLAEFQAEQRQGRTDEPYRQCLTYHGFVWREVEQLPMLEGGVYRREGEWRSAKLRLAFTPTDLASSFPTGPESLDRYIRDELLKRQVTAGRVAKKDLRRSRDRR
jgi:hypothetical protein